MICTKKITNAMGKNREKKVYSKVNNNTLKVITVMVTDKGGLRASGFNNL
jgi:hypothetical protein